LMVGRLIVEKSVELCLLRKPILLPSRKQKDYEQ
jgi:hypothetical protein